MKIDNIFLSQIFDSRGNQTIEVGVQDDGGRIFSASVPSGKSRGTHEAAVFTFAEADTAREEILHHVRGRDYASVAAFDKVLIAFDGTENKSKLGGNFILGASIAFARANAFSQKKLLWEALRGEFFEGVEEKRKPLIFSNLINGGAHAENNLDIQEYMIVAKTGNGSFNESIQELIDFYKDLGRFLGETKKISPLAIGDEGGYSLNFPDNFEPIHILEERIRTAGKENQFTIGIDAAASNFYRNGMYIFDGKKYSTELLTSVYADYFKKSKLLCTIEDPFDETDEKGFGMLFESLHGKWVVGDDLTTTHPKLIERFAEQKRINAVIIKPNQIGTVSEACLAIRLAKKVGIKTIVSHRSGETDDTFIIHLAKAGVADGVKIGAPARERILKFNELVRVFG